MQPQRLRPSRRATKPALSHVKSLRTTPDKSDIAWLLTWRASWMAASGVVFERGEGSMAKLAASEVAVRTTERAIQTMGGWGYIKDHPVEKWYRDAKLYTIFEGISEIQGIVISNARGAADGKPPCTSTSRRPVDR
jgi:alkylation response protein AidB-like acyl-CoA dehydrogenase